MHEMEKVKCEENIYNVLPTNVFERVNVNKTQVFLGY